MARMGKIGLWAIATLMAGMVATSTASATSYDIMAWGSNYWGELGIGSYTKHTEPVNLLRPTGVTAISAGNDFSLALLDGSTVESWGYNGQGELGNGTTKESDRPVTVHDLSEVSAISAGGDFSLALLEDHKVKAWGANNVGQLGVGSTENKLEPVLIPGLEKVIAVSAGKSFSSEEEFGLALLEDGHVMAWGDNTYGQLGIGSTTGPEKCSSIACSKMPVEVHGLEHVVAVSAGDDFALALLENGHVMAWGSNNWGQLGDGTEESRDEPVEVHGLEEKVKAISAGEEFSLALLANNTVVAWGDNEHGELGDGSSEYSEACSGVCSAEPVAVTGLSEVAAISAGGEHSLALLKSGTVKAWGRNEEGDLGDGKAKGPEECGGYSCSRRPVTVDRVTRDVVGVSAGEEHNLLFGPPGPIVKTVAPKTGEPGGGTKVTITGVNFIDVTAIKFGSYEVKKEDWEVNVAGTEISVTSPPGTGKVPVKVTTASGMYPTAGDIDFRYVTPGAPEFGRCKAVTPGTGGYSNSVCTLEATGGSYKWFPSVEKRYFTLEGGESTLETVGKASVICKAATGSGEYNETKSLADTVLKLTSCEHAGSKCTSEGASEGEVVTSPLEGELGWYVKADADVALALSPEEEEAPFAEFKCGATPVMIRGAVLDEVGHDKMQTTPTLDYEASKGKQKVERFQGGSKEVLEMSFSGEEAFEQGGLTASFTLTNEEEVEINASV